MKINRLLLKTLFLSLLTNFSISLMAQSGTGFTYTTLYNNIIGNITGTWTGVYTLETWVKLPPSLPSNFSNIIHIGTSDLTRLPAIYCYPNSSQLHIRSATSANPNEGCDTPTQMALNTWFHLAVVHNLSGIIVYVNGVVVCTNTVGGPLSFINQPFYASDTWLQTTGAVLNELRLWNTTRTVSELTSNSNKQIANHANLVFYYGGPVLPVELLDFSGTSVVCSARSNCFGKEVKNVLKWQTANEINTLNFDIERSFDGKNFDKISTIKAQGSKSNYQFTDDIDLSTVVFYRLKINPLNSGEDKVSFSKVISLENPKLLRGLKIYPSPVKDVLTVETDAKGDYQVINLLGEQVAQGQLGNPINVSALPQGIYMLKIGIEQMKFIKQ